MDAADDLFAADFSRHRQVLGPAGVKAIMARLGAAMPDLHYTIEDIVAQEDRVVIRRRSQGTYMGAAIDHPVFGRVTSPAGHANTVNAVNIFRLVDGKVAETWEYADMADLANFGQLLSVLPAPNSGSRS